MLKSNCKESQQEIVFFKGMYESKPTYRDQHQDILLYQNTPTSRICHPLWGGLQKYIAEELQSLQNRCVDIIGIPRTSLPILEDRCNIATKRELERVVNYINYPNQIFLTKPNTSHGYNLRSKPGSLSSNTTVRDAKTCKFIYSKSCKTSLMTCYVYLLTYLPTFLLE